VSALEASRYSSNSGASCVQQTSSASSPARAVSNAATPARHSWVWMSSSRPQARDRAAPSSAMVPSQSQISGLSFEFSMSRRRSLKPVFVRPTVIGYHMPESIY